MPRLRADYVLMAWSLGRLVVCAALVTIAALVVASFAARDAAVAQTGPVEIDATMRFIVGRADGYCGWTQFLDVADHGPGTYVVTRTRDGVTETQPYRASKNLDSVETVGARPPGRLWWWISGAGNSCSASYDQYVANQASEVNSFVYRVTYAPLPSAATGTIRGRITNTDGKAVAGLLVTVVGAEDNKQVVTDDNGDYTVEVPPGAYVVTPRDYATAYDPNAPQVLQFDMPQKSVTVADQATVDFGLSGWSLSGVITEDRQHTPVPGVRVKIWEGERAYIAITDVDGRYEITLPEGTYTVEPRTPIPHPDAGVAGGAFRPRRQAVGLRADIESANFEVDTTLDLELTIDSAGGSRKLIRIAVRNQDGDPVPNQMVELTGQTFPPWGLVCRTNGSRVWPTVLPHHGDGFIPTANDENPIQASTDSSGVAEFYLLAGTQAGEYSMEARIADSTRAGETDVASVSLSAGPNGLPNASELADELVLYLRTTQTRAGNSEQGADVGQTSFLMAMAQHNFNLAAYAPIQAADGSGAGILFYRSSDADTTDAILDVLLRSGEIGQGAIQAFVLDANPLEFLGQGNPVPPELPTLREWIDGYTGQSRGRLSDLNNPNAKPPAGFVAAAHGAARPGRLGAGEDETQLTFWGWPTPPPPGSGEPWTVFSRCTGTTWRASASSVYSPVNLLYVDGDGNRLGYDAAGEFFGEIPGGFVSGEPGDEPVTYILPVGDYDVQVFGTGTGPATIRFETPGEDGPGFTTFSFEAGDNVDGSVMLTGNVPASVMAYGGAFVSATAGLSLSIDGLPASLPADAWAEVSVNVADQFGRPAGGATVHAYSSDGSVEASTVVAPDGTATLAVRPVTRDLPVILEVGGPGWEPLTASIATTAALPPPEPDVLSSAATAVPTGTTSPAAAPDVAAAGDAGEDEGGSSRAFLIIILVAAALAAGGGYLVWRRRASSGE